MSRYISFPSRVGHKDSVSFVAHPDGGLDILGYINGGGWGSYTVLDPQDAAKLLQFL